MTKQEFLDRLNTIDKPIIEKYSIMLYYLASDVLNICAMEELVEARGLKTERHHYENSHQLYSIITDGDKVVGVISNQGLPTIEFYKRRRKYCLPFLKNPEFIEPIKGVHRILDWHEVRGKMHILAGGETVLHFLPLAITDKDMQRFLKKTGLIDCVEAFKAEENRKLNPDELQEFNNLLNEIQ